MITLMLLTILAASLVVAAIFANRYAEQMEQERLILQVDKYVASLRVTATAADEVAAAFSGMASAFSDTSQAFRDVALAIGRTKALLD